MDASVASRTEERIAGERDYRNKPPEAVDGGRDGDMSTMDAVVWTKLLRVATRCPAVLDGPSGTW